MTKTRTNPQAIEEHCTFLTETLIPDLRVSGLDATANDFELCVDIIRQLTAGRETLGKVLMIACIAAPYYRGNDPMPADWLEVLRDAGKLIEPVSTLTL